MIVMFLSDSHSDGTHSLRRHFSKSDEEDDPGRPAGGVR